ncbi:MULTISPECIES: DUF3631 domain-containing protein [Pseudomonas]|uniref:DUF3631 domain-containing protein n=1 Tax=Pseudomonas TaxID=286 RepID=UPI0004D43428|nr:MULTISPECIES: DUF3631 domain-containing protein [Pseudomonas]KES20931.1 hypothetical protein FG99_27730 [Pseudomonas sp. AAC]OHR86546.1 hypothetical protein HMPREF3289_24635 [Pseudomonas sp. HMSC75E02]
MPTLETTTAAQRARLLARVQEGPIDTLSARTELNILHSDPALWEQLRSRLARFALDNSEAIGKARPKPIEGLNDRANDAWEPLLAIAD